MQWMASSLVPRPPAFFSTAAKKAARGGLGTRLDGLYVERHRTEVQILETHQRIFITAGSGDDESHHNESHHNHFTCLKRLVVTQILLSDRRC